jgi:hypothetical protein
VFAACAHGIEVSEDLGETWSNRIDGLDQPYCRAVTVCGDAVLVSSSRGPRGGDAAVYRGTRKGDRFERCRAGLPDAFDQNVDSAWLDALPDGSLAAFAASTGDVFSSVDQGATWTAVASALPGIRCLLLMP